MNLRTSIIVVWLYRLTVTIRSSSPVMPANSFNANRRRLSMHLKTGCLVFLSVVSKTVKRKKGADTCTFPNRDLESIAVLFDHIGIYP